MRGSTHGSQGAITRGWDLLASLLLAAGSPPLPPALRCGRKAHACSVGVLSWQPPGSRPGRSLLLQCTDLSWSRMRRGRT